MFLMMMFAALMLSCLNRQAAFYGQAEACGGAALTIWGVFSP